MYSKKYATTAKESEAKRWNLYWAIDFVIKFLQLRHENNPEYRFYRYKKYSAHLLIYHIYKIYNNSKKNRTTDRRLMRLMLHKISSSYFWSPLMSIRWHIRFFYMFLWKLEIILGTNGFFAIEKKRIYIRKEK